MSTTTMVKVRAGECIILPGNAKIISAITAGADPTVDSTDCPQLADDIQTAIDSNNFVTYYVRFHDSNSASTTFSTVSKSYQDVTLQAICIAGTCYPVKNVEVDFGKGSGLSFGSWNKNAAIKEWQSALDLTGTPYAGLLTITDASYSSDGYQGKAGNNVRLVVRGPQKVMDALLFQMNGRRGTAYGQKFFVPFNNDN